MLIIFCKIRGIIANVCYCLFSAHLNKIFHIKYVYIYIHLNKITYLGKIRKMYTSSFGSKVFTPRVLMHGFSFWSIGECLNLL